MRTHSELRLQYKNLADSLLDAIGNDTARLRLQQNPEKQKVDIVLALIASMIRGHEEKNDIEYEHEEFLALINQSADGRTYTETEKRKTTKLLKKTFAQLSPVSQKKFFAALDETGKLESIVENAVEGTNLLTLSFAKAVQKYLIEEASPEILLKSDKLNIADLRQSLDLIGQRIDRRKNYLDEKLEVDEYRPLTDSEEQLFHFYKANIVLDHANTLTHALKIIILGQQENIDTKTECDIVLRLSQAPLNDSQYKFYKENNADIFESLSDTQLNDFFRALRAHKLLIPFLFNGMIIKEKDGKLRFVPFNFTSRAYDEEQAFTIPDANNLEFTLDKFKNNILPEKVFAAMRSLGFFPKEKKTSSAEMGQELGESEELIGLRHQYDVMLSSFEEQNTRRKPAKRSKELKQRIESLNRELVKQNALLIKVLLQSTAEESPLATNDAELIFKFLSEPLFGQYQKNARATWEKSLDSLDQRELYNFLGALHKFGYLELLIGNPDIELTALTPKIIGSMLNWYKFEQCKPDILKIIKGQLILKNYNPEDWQTNFDDGLYIQDKNGLKITFRVNLYNDKAPDVMIDFPADIGDDDDFKSDIEDIPAAPAEIEEEVIAAETMNIPEPEPKKPIPVIEVKNLLPDGEAQTLGISFTNACKPRERPELRFQDRKEWILEALQEDGFDSTDLAVYSKPRAEAEQDLNPYNIIEAMRGDYYFQIAVCDTVGNATFIIREPVEFNKENNDHRTTKSELKMRADVYQVPCFNQEQLIKSIRYFAYTPTEQLNEQLKSRIAWADKKGAVLEFMGHLYLEKGIVPLTQDRTVIELLSETTSGPRTDRTMLSRLYSALQSEAIKGLEHVRTFRPLIEEALGPGIVMDGLAPTVDAQNAFNRAVLYARDKQELPVDPELEAAFRQGRVLGLEKMGLSLDIQTSQDFWLATQIATLDEEDKMVLASPFLINQIARHLEHS